MIWLPVSTPDADKNGGLLRPFREIASSNGLYAIPKPPRSTKRLPNSRPSIRRGLHANPSCGPKLLVLASYSVPPRRTRVPTSRSGPDPRTAVDRCPFFSEIGPKYSQRRPIVTVKLDLTL